MAHFHAFQRDYQRLSYVSESINALPLGACALAGTSFPIDRKYVARLLGFKKVIPNSMDAVSDRDFAIDFIYAASIAMLHLSCLMEELIIWSTPYFGFIEISDEFCTTSSIMPQKKNPDVAELIRAKTSKVYGNLFSFLSLMKALPLTYNRDMQEGNALIIDTVSILKKSLNIGSDLIKGARVNKRNMEASLKKGFLEATEVTDYLTKKGVPFRSSHEIVARLVRDLNRKGRKFSDLSISEFKKYSPYFSHDIKEILSPEAIIKNKISEGSTSQAQICKDIRDAKRLLRLRSQ
jgi:argininosuccinate lyase